MFKENLIKYDLELIEYEKMLTNQNNRKIKRNRKKNYLIQNKMANKC